MLNSLKLLANGILEKAKTFKGDWNENDSSSPNYIKNRPFYTKEEAETFFSLHIESFYSENDYYIYEYELQKGLPLEVGEKYTVVWNGTKYNNIEYKLIPSSDGDGFCLGNGNIFYSDADDTGEPFLIEIYDDKYMYIETRTDLATMFEIKTVKEEIKKIDKKYIPDSVSEDEVNNMIMDTYGYSTMNTYEIVIEHNHANTIYMTNRDTVVYANSSYTNTFTIRDGEFGYVHVEMNGKSLNGVTEFINYKEYRVNIPNVIGNIEIYIYTLS